MQTWLQVRIDLFFERTKPARPVGGNRDEQPVRLSSCERLPSNYQINLAGPTRLELATSGVTGRRSIQLNYDPALSLTVTG